MEPTDGRLPLTVAVPVETSPREARVALTPAVLPAFTEAGIRVVVESGAGERAGFSDQEYRERGAEGVGSRAEAFSGDVIAQVRTAGANPHGGADDIPLMRPGQAIAGFANPLGAPDVAARVADRGVSLFAMELMPRISRAQGMDALSSQATIAGYKAVLLAAGALPKIFPMLTTAAGTLSPARVLVVGAGVAGLQAIATARRLGALVEAYDVRPAVKEQVESLGARFVELPLESADAEDRGGYARAPDEDFYRRQRELMTRVVAASDIVITTALVPGQPAPVLVTTEMVEAMAPGSVIVDLAAEQGGNCEPTRADETLVHHDVTVMGPTNLPATVPNHASLMYAKNLSSFLLHLLRDIGLPLDLDDQITRETLVTKDGAVVHPRLAAGTAMPEAAARTRGT